MKTKEKSQPNTFHLHIQKKYRKLTTPNKKEKKEKLDKKYKKYLQQE